LGDGIVAFKGTQAIALPQELSQERGLVVDLVMEVITGEVEDDLTCAASVEVLTLLSPGWCRRWARSKILADFMRISVGVVLQLREDGDYIVVDDLDAASDFLCREAVHRQVLALKLKLRLERVLVGDVVVEMALGDSDDNFAGTAGVVHGRGRRLAFLAPGHAGCCWYAYTEVHAGLLAVLARV